VQADTATLSAASDTRRLVGAASGFTPLSYQATVAEKLDLDRALTLLPEHARLCIVALNSPTGWAGSLLLGAWVLKRAHVFER